MDWRQDWTKLLLIVAGTLFIAMLTGILLGMLRDLLPFNIFLVVCIGIVLVLTLIVWLREKTVPPPPLIEAVILNDANGVAELLAEGADPNTRGPEGSTALILAAAEGNLEIVEILLAAGANVNERNDGGFTALMAATGASNVEIMRVLLNSGADVNSYSKEGQTALSIAINGGFTDGTEVIRLLIAAGARPYIRKLPDEFI